MAKFWPMFILFRLTDEIPIVIADLPVIGTRRLRRRRRRIQRHSNQQWQRKRRLGSKRRQQFRKRGCLEQWFERLRQLSRSGDANQWAQYDEHLRKR
jgi:hypothetical protein